MHTTSSLPSISITANCSSSPAQKNVQYVCQHTPSQFPPCRLSSTSPLELVFIILIEQQQLKAAAFASTVHAQSKHSQDFLSLGFFTNLFLRSQGPIHLTIELHSLVYHFPHIREQKQLKAKGAAVYNVSGAVGAPAVSCLCPGSSKIPLAAEG